MMQQTRPSFTPTHAALWMMGALFCMVLMLGLATSLNPDIIEDQVSLGALSAVSFLIVTSLLLGRHPGGNQLREAIGARPAHPVLLPLAGAIGFLAQSPAEEIRDFLHRLLPPADGAAPAGVTLAAHSQLESAALVVVLVGLVPLAEEVFFRGAIFGALRRSQYSARAAAIISAIGFTLCHVNAQLLLPIGFVATIFGVLRASSGSLYPSLVAHMVFNAVPVVSVMNRWEAFEPWSHQHRAAIAAGLLFCVVGFIVIASRSKLAGRGREEEAQPVLAVEVEGRG